MGDLWYAIAPGYTGKGATADFATGKEVGRGKQAEKDAQDLANQQRQTGLLDDDLASTQNSAQKQRLLKTAGQKKGQELQEGSFITPQGRRIFS